VVAQRLGAQQIEYFFDTVIYNLRTQAEGTSHSTQQLAAQQQLARETTRKLMQVSTDNYMELLDSVFSFYQGGTSRIRRRAEEANSRVEEAEARVVEARGRAEEAERQTERAQRRYGEIKRSLEEAQRRILEADKRAEEAERRRSEAESQRGDEDSATKAAAVHQPLSKWVRTSGRSKVRGRNTRSRGRSSGRR
jgi:chromosome segregation ATPase